MMVRKTKKRPRIWHPDNFGQTFSWDFEGSARTCELATRRRVQLALYKRGGVIGDLLNDKEGTDSEGVDPRAIVATNGFAGIGN